MRTRWIAIPVFLVVCLSLQADLDIGVPVGSPLDWDKELHQPIPTGLMGKGPAKQADPSGQGTVVSAKLTPPPMGYTSINLYNFLRVKTHDIMTHFTVKVPDRNPVPVKVPGDNTIDTGNAGGKSSRKIESGMEGKYPPKVPGELVWIAIANCLRTVLHAELMNEAETLAYLIELGEPSLVAADTVDSPLKDKLKKLITDIPPQAPQPPSMGNGKNNMLAKVATLELMSGYPYAIDPTYAKRTLLAGDLAYEAVLKCAESNHTFLARNAVAILANFPGEKPAKDLERIFKHSKDPVILVRCLAGMARKKDKSHIKTLQSAAQSRDDWLRAMAIYALGHVATEDKDSARMLAGMAQSATLEQLWTLLPAIARIGDKSPDTQSTLRSLYTKLWEQAKGIPHPIPKGDVPNDFAPNPEPAGYRKRIVADLCLIALAASGDTSALQEIVAKLSKGGLEAFTEASWMLLAELLGGMGDKGLEEAKKLATHSEVTVAMQAVRGMAKSKAPDIKWLKELAMGRGGSAMVRAAALTVLYQHTVGEIREACHSILQSGGGGAEQAYLVGMAIQMLDRLGDNKGDELLKVVEANKSSTAKREATDEYDITKCKIDVFPPLLEIAVLALARTQHEPAIPTLMDLLKDSKVRAEAALALGSMPLKGDNLTKVPQALLEALVDPKDGWVRFCAYLALKNMTGKDYFTDYIFGTASSIFGCQEKYRKEFEKK